MNTRQRHSEGRTHWWGTTQWGQSVHTKGICLWCHLYIDWKSSSTQGIGESVLRRTAVWQHPLARKECRMYASLSSTFSHQSQSPDYDITVSECRFVQIHWQLFPSINDSNIQTTAMISNLKQKVIILTWLLLVLLHLLYAKWIFPEPLEHLHFLNLHSNMLIPGAVLAWFHHYSPAQKRYWKYKST